MPKNVFQPQWAAFFQRGWQWAGAHAAGSATAILFVAFLTYLRAEEVPEFVYDAQGYWLLAEKYWEGGSFHFMAFDSLLRGYLFPLLLSPLAWLAQHRPWTPVELFQGVGAGMAAALFGWVGPGLWQAVRQQPAAALWRRLVFGSLGLMFWRGYFHYPLTDFPALLALAGGLWALVRGRSVGSGLLAGVLVAAAANFRPVYAAALPIAGIICLGPRVADPATGWVPRPWYEWGRRAAFVAGLVLVLWPQSAVNSHRFGSSSPFVLTHSPAEPSLYLLQLQLGLLYEKYETSIAPDYPKPQMAFIDPLGKKLWPTDGSVMLTDYGQYGQLAMQEPVAVAGVWLRHLFNALDLQYPTPYIERVYVSTWGLAWLNYTVLFGGIWVLGRSLARGMRRPTWAGLHGGLVALALLGTCGAVLPVAIECRFLLPLHLLLCAALAFGAPLGQAGPTGWRQWTAAAILYVGVMTGCFALSMRTQLHLERGPRKVFDWQETGPQPW